MCCNRCESNSDASEAGTGKRVGWFTYPLQGMDAVVQVRTLNEKNNKRKKMARRRSKGKIKAEGKDEEERKNTGEENEKNMMHMKGKIRRKMTW
jgi:hypothetical protein